MAIIRLLGRTLRANAPGVLPILSMDAVRVHLHDRVILECANWGIRVVVVPARMTWLLQPLDTHVFAQLKRVVRDAYQARLGSEGARALSTASWVAVVTNTVYCFLRRENWARAFAHRRLRVHAAGTFTACFVSLGSASPASGLRDRALSGNGAAAVPAGVSRGHAACDARS